MLYAIVTTICTHNHDERLDVVNAHERLVYSLKHQRPRVWNLSLHCVCVHLSVSALTAELFVVPKVLWAMKIWKTDYTFISFQKRSDKIRFLIDFTNRLHETTPPKTYVRSLWVLFKDWLLLRLRVEMQLQNLRETLSGERLHLAIKCTLRHFPQIALHYMFDFIGPQNLVIKTCKLQYCLLEQYCRYGYLENIDQLIIWNLSHCLHV